MIYKWFSVAFQETPDTLFPWVVLKNTFSEFNGMQNFKIISRCKTREEADLECRLAEELD